MRVVHFEDFENTVRIMSSKILTDKTITAVCSRFWCMESARANAYSEDLLHVVIFVVYIVTVIRICFRFN